MRRVIDRDEVLHVARLARLRLDEDEIEPLARELSAILDHVAHIDELDLEGVVPTTHVVEMTGALRADEPRASLPREVALAQAPAVSGERIFGTEPAGVSGNEIIDLSAAEAARKIAAGELSADELFDAYRARAAADELNCFTWVAPERTNGAGGDRGSAPGAGVPLAVKDLFCTEGVPSQSGSRILEGYEPPYTATVVRKLQAAGASLLGKTNQDEFAMGSSNENSAYGPVLNPWDRTRVPGGSSGGSAAAVAAGPRAMGAGDRHGRLDPPAGRAVRDRRPETDVWLGVPLRDDRVRLLAGSGRAADARRDRRGAVASAHGGTRPVRCHLAGVPARDRAAERRAPGRDQAGCAGGADRRRDGRCRGRRWRGGGRRGDRSGRARGVPARLGSGRGAGRGDRGERQPAARAARAVRLLRARARGGLLEPGAVRRGPLRAAEHRSHPPGGPAGDV